MYSISPVADFLISFSVRTKFNEHYSKEYYLRTKFIIQNIYLPWGQINIYLLH